MEIIIAIVLIFFGVFLFFIGYYLYNEIFEDVGALMSFLGFLCCLAGGVLFLQFLTDSDLHQIDTSCYEVYINGEEIDRELINIDDYSKVTYDYENERILIAID